MTPTNAVCPVVTMRPEWLDEAVLPADDWLDAPRHPRRARPGGAPSSDLRSVTLGSSLSLCWRLRSSLMAEPTRAPFPSVRPLGRTLHRQPATVTAQR